MGYPEETAYMEFEGVCRTCGETFTYHNSVRRHPELTECIQCEAAKIAELLTGRKSFEGAVKGWG